MRKSLTVYLLILFFFAGPLFAGGIREESKTEQITGDAEFYYNRGLEHLENGELDLAIKDFSQAILLEPNNGEFYNKRGEAYFWNGEYDLTLKDASQAVLLEPDNTEFLDNRGTLYSLLGEYELAIKDLSKAILLEPDNAVFYYDRGSAHHREGKFDLAIEDISRAILLEPDNAFFHAFKGTVHGWKGENDLAIENFTRAISLGPDNADFYDYRGYAYIGKREYDMAIEDFSTAILLDPNLSSAYNNRGNAYIWIREYDLAIEDCSTAILLDPDNASAYDNRGTAYTWKKEYDLAIEDCSAAILLNPNFSSAYHNRGNAHSWKSEYDLAIEDFSTSILLDPNNAMVYENRGNAYDNKGENDLALKDYSQVILLNPSLASAYDKRGSKYAEKGEYDIAIEDFSQAILLDPNFAEAYKNRGSLYAIKGEYDIAIEDYSQAILLDPNFANAFSFRGSAYDFKGEYDLAINDFSQAILLDPNYASSYNSRGMAYSKRDKTDLAIEDFSQAILLEPNSASSYNSRGIAYTKKGEYDLAIEDISQAILLDPSFALFYIFRGITYHHKGEYDLANMDYKESLAVAEKNVNLNFIFYASIPTATIFYNFYPYLNTENEPLAKSLADVVMDGISKSVRRAENVRSSLGTRGSAIMEEALFFYYMGVDFETHYGSPEKAFAFSESLRSRGFLDQIGTEAALRLPGISEEERGKMRSLLTEIENRQNVLDSFRERPPQNREEENSFVSAGQRLSVLEAEISSLDADISKRIPGYTDLRNPAPATLEQAVDWLADDTAVLIYTLWDESIYKSTITALLNLSPPTINSYCMVLTKNGLETVTLDHDFRYRQAINLLRTIIMSKGTGGEVHRNSLYNALIKPVLAHIPANVNKLIIVPDGTLGSLPFDILRENKDSPDLGETYRLSLSPSVSVSMLAKKTASQNLPILAFGGAWYEGNQQDPDWPDLPGTEAEVKMLAGIVPSAEHIRVFRGGDVSEETVKKLSGAGELANYPILHFAAHGYFKEDDLERAGIVLSEVSGLLDNDEDGYLTIPEIVVLRLNSQMVLLSACQTGLGQFRRGDGMVGMVRAFLIAGAKHLGVSLWLVDDAATLEFMTRLYGKVLNEGISFKEAYYLVKNEFRYMENSDKGGYNEVYYWSAFVIYE